MCMTPNWRTNRLHLPLEPSVEYTVDPSNPWKIDGGGFIIDLDVLRTLERLPLEGWKTCFSRIPEKVSERSIQVFVRHLQRLGVDIPQPRVDVLEFH